MKDYLYQAPEPMRDFLTYMETIMGRSPLTVKNYFMDLRLFSRWLMQHRNLVSADQPFDHIDISKLNLHFYDTVSKSEIYDFMLFLSRERPQHSNSPTTRYGIDSNARARKTSVLRSFYRYLTEKTGQIKNNPMLSVDRPKTRKALPKYLSLQDSLQLLGSVDGFESQRDYCILTLFLNCGLRVSELVGINKSDVVGLWDDDPNAERHLRVLGKGNKERILYLNDACIQAMRAYDQNRLPANEKAKNAFFISRLGNRISVQTVQYLVKKHLSEAGLSGKNLSVHKLRHTAATLMYQNGVDVRTLKEVLGHESLNTTAIYTHVVSDDLVHAAKNNPLADVKPPENKKND